MFDKLSVTHLPDHLILSMIAINLKSTGSDNVEILGPTLYWHLSRFDFDYEYCQDCKLK